MTILDQSNNSHQIADLRGGRILFTQDVAMGYNFVKGESTKLHWSVDSGACIFWPDEIRLQGEVTEDVLATLRYIPE